MDLVHHVQNDMVGTDSVVHRPISDYSSRLVRYGGNDGRVLLWWDRHYLVSRSFSHSPSLLM